PSRRDGGRHLVSHATSDHTIVITVEFETVPVNGGRGRQGVDNGDLRRPATGDDNGRPHGFVFGGDDLLAFTNRARKGGKFARRGSWFNYQVKFVGRGSSGLLVHSGRRGFDVDHQHQAGHVAHAAHGFFVLMGGGSDVAGVVMQRGYVTEHRHALIG